MTFNFKKALLAGTAIVAVGAIGAQAHAADLVLGGNATWNVDGTVAAPTAADNVDVDGNSLTIDDRGDQIAVGAITDTGTPRDGDVIITSDTALADVTATVGSLDIGGNFTVQSLNADDSTVAATVNGATTVGGALVVTNATETDAADTITLTLTGNANVTGTTGVTAGGLAAGGTTATLNVDGAANVFTGTVTITGGAGNAANDAIIAVSGASTNFAGGLVLTDGAAGQAILAVDGTVAQTIAGAISGNGDINISNAAGVTFTGNNTNTGTISVNSSGTNQSVTFTGDVSSTISVGDNVGTDTKTLTFGGSGATAVSGAISGGGASDTVNLVFTGGNTVTLSGAANTNIDSVLVQNNTTLSSSAAVETSGAVTVDAGSTLNKGAGNITATGGFTNSGTLISSGAGNFTGAIVNNGVIQKTGGAGQLQGAITGTGSLDVDSALTVTAGVTQSAVDIAAVTLTQSAASGYTVGTTNFSGAGTLALTGGDQTVTGNFTNTTDGEGTISVTNVAGTVNFVGNLGASADNSLAALTATGANITGVTTTGNLFVDAIGLDDTNFLRFLGTSAQTVSGTITGGDLDFVDGTDVTLGTLTSIDDVTIADGATARFGGVSGIDTIANDGNLFANNNVTLTGGFTQTATGATTVGVNNTLSATSFSDAGLYTINATDADLTLTAADLGGLTDSDVGSTLGTDKVTFNVTGDLGAATGAGTTVAGIFTGINFTDDGATFSDNSIKYSFVADNNGADADVVITSVTNASLATAPNAGAAAVLDTLSADADFATVNDNLASASTQEEFNEILESVAPTVDGGAIVSGYQASVQSIDVSNTRLASLRDGNETAMVAGEMGNGLSAWVQGFGHTADQDRRDGVDGYDSDTYGMAVGLDTANVLEQGTVGVALSYADTEVDSRNANRTNSEVDSYQLSLYGDYDVAPNTYLSSTLAYAWNDIDQTRSDVGGVGSGITANGDFDSDQFIAYAEVGHDIALDEVTTLTPHVLAHYQHINVDGYTETGAGGLNLAVNDQDYDIFELGIGAELAWNLDAGNGAKIRPALNVGYRHDLVGDEVQTTSNFTGGGASFQTNGLEPAQGTFNVGASLGYAMDNNWNLTVDYDYEVKSDYDAHSGFVRAGYKF